MKGDLIRRWYCKCVKPCAICWWGNKCEAETGSAALWELSERLECVFHQSEGLAEAPRCKIINLDHKSSLQRITILPEPIKCNMHAIINVKIPQWNKRASLCRKGQDLAVSPEAWHKPPPCQATNPVTRQISELLRAELDSIKSRHACVLWCEPKLLP